MDLKKKISIQTYHRFEISAVLYKRTLRRLKFHHFGVRLTVLAWDSENHERGCSLDRNEPKGRSVQLYTVVRSKVGLYGQNEQHLVTLLGSPGPLLACPALPSELGRCCWEHCQCTGAVQCCTTECSACAVTRAIYRHSLSIGNKTSAGCLAARCMVQNDPFWCSLQNVFKNSLIFKTFLFQLSFLKWHKILTSRKLYFQNGVLYSTALVIKLDHQSSWNTILYWTKTVEFRPKNWIVIIVTG